MANKWIIRVYNNNLLQLIGTTLIKKPSSENLRYLIENALYFIVIAKLHGGNPRELATVPIKKEKEFVYIELKFKKHTDLIAFLKSIRKGLRY